MIGVDNVEIDKSRCKEVPGSLGRFTLFIMNFHVGELLLKERARNVSEPYLLTRRLFRFASEAWPLN